MKTRRNLRILGALALGLLTASNATGKPAMKGIRTVTQPDGTELRIRVTGDEHLHFTTTEDGAILHLDDDGFYRLGTIAADGAVVSTGVMPGLTISKGSAVYLSDLDVESVAAKRKGKRRAPQSGYGMASTSFPTKGSPKVLIVLVEYSDVQFKTVYDAKSYFNNMINGENFNEYGGTGSALEYFTLQSKGLFTPQFDVYGPVKLPNTQYYYGRNDRYGDDENAHMMAVHALEALDSEVDFSQYDTDGDGIIDNVYIFYAGQGEADYGSSNTVWPHAWDVRYGGVNKKVDGVTIGHYACSNEWESRKPSGVGNFIHEFSHVMGLPDLYHTTDYTANYTPDAYSALDYGPYNNDGRTPPNYSAYERNALKWQEPIVLEGPASVSMGEITEGEFYLIPTEKTTEFFLLENRQQTGWDFMIPGHGMLIWHIDYVENVFKNNTVNNTKGHQYVDIVEANNRQNNNYAEGYTFPGTSNVTSFTSSTTPALKSWNGRGIDLPLTNIRETDGIISFDIAGGGTTLGVEDIVSEPEGEKEYFTLQGIRIADPQPGTIVIERSGANVRKIRVR